jgi:N-acetylglutamate synthase-like GNAT family acetyltransferase
LQKLAYLSEAKLLNNFSIQPLTQTLEELQNEFDNYTLLKLTDDKNNIIGSIRANEENERVNIGKLIVHPDCQNNGLGAKLLAAIETYYENKVFELFTSSKSIKNLYIYNKHGYKEFMRKKLTEDLELIYLEKNQK